MSMNKSSARKAPRGDLSFLPDRGHRVGQSDVDAPSAGKKAGRATQLIGSRQLIVAFVVLAILAVGGLVATRQSNSSAAASYMTAPVVRGDIESVVMATGTLQAYQQVDVGAQVSGQLKSLKVGLGDHVAKGQLLAEVDPVLLKNALRSAKASMDSLAAQRRAAAANLSQADFAYGRQQKMIARDATSRQELEAANAQMLVARANLASFDAQIVQAKTQVDSARANLAYTKITAPMDGEVVAIVTQEGQTVVAAQQAPVILRLANLGTMTVKAQISEADVIRIQAGQKAYFTILGDSGERYAGALRAIEPGPEDFSNGTSNGQKANGPVFYDALFEVPNPARRLRIGMTAQVTVVLAEAKDALVVPIAALGKPGTDGRHPVRVRRPDGTVTTVTVAVGISNNVNMQVTDGLAEGDEVITAEHAAK
jgi:macrolide-specific efflux system membrane fusion protein